MARTRKEPEGNPRLARDFWTNIVLPPMSEAVEAYELLEPFSIAGKDEQARLFDTAFGVREVCEAATRARELQEHLAKATKPLPVGHPLMFAPTFHVAGHWHTLRFDAHAGRPTIYFQCKYDSHYYTFATPMFALSGRVAVATHPPSTPFRVVRPAEELTPTQQAQIESIHAWALRAANRHYETERALAFVQEIRMRCDSTHSFFRALPGMRDVLRTLGISNDDLAHGDKPYRGHEDIHTIYLDHALPMWRTRWSNEVRPDLLRFAAAKNSDRTAVNLALPAMSRVVVQPE
jgi:hypothetical protein